MFKPRTSMRRQTRLNTKHLSKKGQAFLVGVTLILLACTVSTVSTMPRSDSTIDQSLTAAIENRDYRTVDRLLKMGANPNGRWIPQRHELPDAFAARVQYVVEAVKETLRGDNLYDTNMMLAAGNGDIAIMKRLCDEGAEVNATNGGGYTALMYAAANGDMTVVRFLLLRGADARMTDRWRRSAADHAREWSYDEVAHLIDAANQFP